jgi:DNA primase
MAILQHPAEVGAELIERVSLVRFTNPTLSVVRDAVATSIASHDSPDWVAAVTAQTPAGYVSLVQQLAVAPIPSQPSKLAAYCSQLAMDLIDRDLARRHAEVLGALQRTDPVDEQERRRQLQEELAGIVDERRRLRKD